MAHTLRTSSLFVVAIGLAVLAGCVEKSRNPLSPSLAGPIEGVSLTVPGLMSPTNGALIQVDEQPVRVTFANGESNGQRPVLYNVRLALDADFLQVVHEATKVPGDPSGQTTYDLPAGLDPGTTYYWQVQTDDGANASEHSGASSFEVFTPVVIEPPQIQAPGADIGDGTASVLVISAPAVDGPASNLQYELQVASDEGFSNVVLSITGPLEGSSETVTIASLFGNATQTGGASLTAQSVSPQAASGLAGDTKYHWRARVSADGREGTVVGPWSPRATFRTPPNPTNLVAPTPLSPVGGGLADSNPPTLVVRNPPVGDAFGSVTIRYEVATDESFGNIVATVAAPMAPSGTTTAQPGALAADRLHYWRARTVSGQLAGPWSPVRRFQSPGASSGGGSTSGDSDSGSGGGDGSGGSGGGGGGGGGGGSSSGGAGDQIDLSQVTWLHHNVSGWPKTSTVTSTSIGNPPICIDHTKRGTWPATSAGGTTVEGNPWIFAKVNGRWYAATYEWLRPGQECKSISAGNIGAHVKQSPLTSWRPSSGEQVGLMVSTPARFGPQGARNERSNVVLVTWP